VDGLKAEGSTASGKPKRVVVYDIQVRGFGVRVTPAGAKSFVIDYRVGHGRNAAKTRHIVGGYGALRTVDTACAEARRLLRMGETGADPAAECAAEREGAPTESTLATLGSESSIATSPCCGRPGARATRISSGGASSARGACGTSPASPADMWPSWSTASKARGSP
jgi:hypothetical protein